MFDEGVGDVGVDDGGGSGEEAVGGAEGYDSEGGDG